MSAAAVAELLARCRSAGLVLVPEGEALHVDFESEPPAALIEEIRQHKPEVMVALASPTVIAPAQWFKGAAAGGTLLGPPRHAEDAWLFRALLRDLRLLGQRWLRRHWRAARVGRRHAVKLGCV